MTAWLLIIGAGMIGFQIPEAFAAFGKMPVALIMNIWWAVGCALIAAGLVL